MIPVSEPLLGSKEAEYVMECIRTGWISSSGHFIEEFEQKWAAYCGMSYGVAVCNGTAALSAALASIGLEPGDEVIMPSFTIISCALAIIENGGIPVLVDSDSLTWTMNVDQVAGKLSARTKAIMPVHIYGHPVDIDPLLELARENNLSIIEDAAEAHGALYKGRKCGGLGNISCFSFYANKIITTGEGGMVLTNDRKLAEKVSYLRNLAFMPDRRFYHTELGHNYRMTNLQAAIGLAQLEKIDQHLAHKNWMGNAYTERLKDLPFLQLPVEKPWAKNVYWMYGVLLTKDAKFDAREFALRLRAKNIETRPFFLGMHEQPVFNKRGLFLGEKYPVAEYLARQGLYLPSGLTLTESQLDQVCEAVREILS